MIDSFLFHARLAATVAAVIFPLHAAQAQRAGDNAVASADDAFGSSVGLEQTGIYSEFDTRGFNPTKAGNGRIDGLYYDPAGSISSRLRSGNAVRVGFSAEDYPFQAPTGIIEYRLRPFPKESGWSLAYNSMAYGGSIREFDVRLIAADRKIAVLGGGAQSNLHFSDGAGNQAWGVSARVIARLGTVEIAPFVALAQFTSNQAHPLVIVTGDYLPEMPHQRRYLGQDWASGRNNNNQMGTIIKAGLTDRLSLRAGIFHADADRQENYSEIFTLLAPDGLARHRLIADPAHRIHSTSGEAQVAWRTLQGGWTHRIIAGFRARRRITDTGGSDLRDFGLVHYGDRDPEIEPQFSFGRPNAGKVRQSAFTLGYLGSQAGLGSINLGLQKASYHGTLHDGRTGNITRSRDNPWLYNAGLTLPLTDHLSLRAAAQRGLEDSGLAPENAVNRNEQLPATRTTQIEAGLRWKFAAGQLVINAFEITKPYFSYDVAGAFARMGQVRHRGIESSISGHIGSRFNLVAGAVLMDPQVSGPGRVLGLVGARPAGIPKLHARLDVHYRTDVFGGLTPTLGFTYTGRRAAGSRPQAGLGGRQLMVGDYPVVDLGLRQQFKIGTLPASMRLVALNVFDAKTWKVAAANTLYMDDRRRFNFTLSADF